MGEGPVGVVTHSVRVGALCAADAWLTCEMTCKMTFACLCVLACSLARLLACSLARFSLACLLAQGVKVDAEMSTSAPGVYAVGDIRNTPYKQVVIGIGPGPWLGLDICNTQYMSRWPFS